MRHLFFICLFALPLLAAAQHSQKKDPVFYAEVPQKEVRLDEALEVLFVVENAQNAKFMPPDWQSAGLEVVSTSTSSNMSISNGVMKSSQQYRYYLQALHAGAVEIPAATLRMGEQEYRTEPVSVQVLPDESGASSRPQKQWRRSDEVQPPAPPAAPAKPKSRRPATRI